MAHARCRWMQKRYNKGLKHKLIIIYMITLFFFYLCFEALLPLERFSADLLNQLVVFCVLIFYQQMFFFIKCFTFAYELYENVYIIFPIHTYIYSQLFMQAFEIVFYRHRPSVHFITNKILFEFEVNVQWMQLVHTVIACEIQSNFAI